MPHLLQKFPTLHFTTKNLYVYILYVYDKQNDLNFLCLTCLVKRRGATASLLEDRLGEEERVALRQTGV